MFSSNLSRGTTNFDSSHQSCFEYKVSLLDNLSHANLPTPLAQAYDLCRFFLLFFVSFIIHLSSLSVFEEYQTNNHLFFISSYDIQYPSSDIIIASS
jgi:hypothetical protein